MTRVIKKLMTDRHPNYFGQAKITQDLKKTCGLSTLTQLIYITYFVIHMLGSKEGNSHKT